MKMYGINCQGPLIIETVTTLPPAGDYEGREVYYNDKRWYSNGTSWQDYSNADTLDANDSAYFQPASTAVKTYDSFGGDVSGTYGNLQVVDDSHAHIIANIDGLQTALNGKQAVGDYLTTTTVFGGDISGTYGATVVANDSHTHDTRYYTESESDSRFVNVTGDVMTGDLSIINGTSNRQIILGNSGIIIGTTSVLGFYKSSDTGKYARFNTSSTNGDFQVTGDVSAYYSDERLKTILGNIENPIKCIKSLNGFRYKNNELAKSLGYTDDDTKVGLSAQALQKVLPEAVVPAPFDTDYDENGVEYSRSGENYLTIKYEKVVPLLVEAIKEQQEIIDANITKINELENRIKYLEDTIDE